MIRSKLAAILAAAALAAFSAQAQAGLDFTDTFQAGNASTGNVTFDAGGGPLSSAAFQLANPTGISLINAFPAFGSDIVTVTSTAAAGVINVAVLDYSYTGAHGGIDNATYAPTVGGPLNPYNMVIQLGSITVAPLATLQLTQIGFTQADGTFAAYSPNIFLTSAGNANRRLYITIPTGVGGVDLVDRTTVQAVSLQFSFTGGAGTSFAVDALVNPEPGTIALFGLGLLGLVGVARRRRRKGTSPDPAA